MIRIDKLKKSSQNTHKSIERKAREKKCKEVHLETAQTEIKHTNRVQGKALQTEGTWGKLGTRLNV